MENKSKSLELNEENMNVPTYSYQLLRHMLIPELLGKEEEMILYWAGKSIARKLYEDGVPELSSFFEQASWGTLSLLKEKRTEKQYELIAPLMEKDRPLTLECGFLAQWTEFQQGFITEATYELKKKKPCTYRIIVRWDKGDPVGDRT
ncbi:MULTISPECIES: YslB family protein [Bacillaceae]|uniref:YslB family protein n=1 Tax=Evansella alkalicola TaxID=745819 RepID=A0ABS6JSZ9_9BACI|nr:MULTISPECIES: YslB family protein [Bacillaceae]MBU9721201.1 YslB family protein [Bacillus alkalicola]